MIIAVSPANQLGNALFNHAHLMAAAWEYNTCFLNPCFDRYADLFPRVRNDPFCAAFPGWLPARIAARTRASLARVAVRLGKAQTARESVGRSLPRTRMISSGWSSTRVDPEGVVHVDREPFRSLARSSRFLLVSGPLFRFDDRERFLLWRNRIADYFRPPDDVVEQAAALASTARMGRPHLIGVHVRRGDYSSFLGGRYFFGWEDYERLMREIARTWGADQVAFVVTGNERAPSGFAADLVWIQGPGDVIADLASLGACDMVIGPPSTFSSWIAFTSGIPIFFIEDPTYVPEPSDFVASRG